MIKAIYKRREDGDYDFVAAFETGQLPALSSDWPGELVEWLNAEGELPLVVENVDMESLPDGDCNFPYDAEAGLPPAPCSACLCGSVCSLHDASETTRHRYPAEGFPDSCPLPQAEGRNEKLISDALTAIAVLKARTNP